MTKIKKSSLRKLIRSMINEQMKKDPFNFGQFSTQFGSKDKFPQITPDHSFLDKFKKDSGGYSKYDKKFLTPSMCKNMQNQKGKMKPDDFMAYTKYCSELQMGRPQQSSTSQTSTNRVSDIQFGTGVEHDCPGCPQQEE